jgi:hypothetical protein
VKNHPAQQHLSALRVINTMRDQMVLFVKIGQSQSDTNAKRHLLFGVGRRLLLIDQTLVHLMRLGLFGRDEHLNMELRSDLDLFLNSFYFHLRGLLGHVFKIT